MAGLDQVMGQQPAAATEFNDEPVALANGVEERQDARRAFVGVEAEPEMVDQGQVPSVIEVTGGVHGPILATPSRPR